MSDDTMVSFTVHDAHPHDLFNPIIRLNSAAMRSIGASEGDALQIVGKRKTVAKCLPLDEPDADGSAWLTHTVRNNAEVPIGGRVDVMRVEAIEAKKLTLVSSYENEISARMDRSGLGHLPAILAGFSVMMQDYIISHLISGGWVVFQLVGAETYDGKTISSKDASTPLLITKGSEFELKKQGELEAEKRSGYPVFCINFQETIKKMDSDNIFLVVAFHGLHNDGRFSGELQKKITKDADIQDLTSQYRELALRTISAINEESGTRNVPSTEVKNRILQGWIAV